MTRRFSLLALAALLFFCIACLGTPGQLPDFNPSAGAAGYIETVDSTVMYNSFVEFAWTEWARTEDRPEMSPVHGLVSLSGHLCIVDGGTWAVAFHGDRYACDERWRTKRHRGLGQ